MPHPPVRMHCSSHMRLQPRNTSAVAGYRSRQKLPSNAVCAVSEQCKEPDGAVTSIRPTRRMFVLHSVLAPIVLGAGVLGTDDTVTILNSVLSGYGLPTLPGANDFKTYDEFEDDYTLQYPKSWISRPNTLRTGLYVSNFQTADKATVEEFDLPPGATSPGDAEVVRRAVAAAIVPGSGSGQADDKLAIPPDRLVKRETRVVDGQEYVYLAFPSETITRSGYNIRRRNLAVVAVKRGRAYTLAASARSDQYNQDKEVLLQRIVESFRLK